jgi:enoyl-[acyl-carrier-protein] reductase (NADH)
VKITTTYLRQVIKEELKAVLNEEENNPVVDGIEVIDATKARALDEAGEEIGEFYIDMDILNKKLKNPNDRSAQFKYIDSDDKIVNIDADRKDYQITAILSQLKDDVNEA